MSVVSKIKRYLKLMVHNIVKGRKVVSAINTPVFESNILENRIIVISGGTGGIGAGVARCCVNSGAKVIILGTNKRKMDVLCSELGEDNCHSILVNLYDFDSYSELIEKANCSFDYPADTLINAAGTMGPMNFLDVSLADWDEVMDLNMKSTFFLSQNFAKKLIEYNKKGHILNISSTSALKPGWTPYGISKSAVNSMTLGMADELIEYGIVVNAVAPGPVATKMLGVEDGNLYNPRYKSGRFATPEEIGNWAVMMISDMGNLVLGDSLYVSGGSGTLDICKTH